MTIANPANEKFFLALIKAKQLRVTKSGRAFNLRTRKEIALYRKDNVYRKISWKNHETGKIVQVQLHRLIWVCFKGRIKNPSLVINHIDGNKANCRLSNLELTTSSNNYRHALTTGLVVPKQADELHNAVFTNEQVVKIRKAFARGKYSLSELSDKLNVAKSTLVNCLRGDSYSIVITKYDIKCNKKLPRAGRGYKIVGQ